MKNRNNLSVKVRKIQDNVRIARVNDEKEEGRRTEVWKVKETKKRKRKIRFRF